MSINGSGKNAWRAAEDGHWTEIRNGGAGESLKKIKWGSAHDALCPNPNLSGGESPCLVTPETGA